MLMMLMYWAEVYIHTIKKSTESLVGAAKEVCLAVNAENTE